MGIVFCRGCGKEIHETAIVCPNCGAPQKTTGLNPSSAKGMSFSAAVSTCFAKYATFSGRASRSEYWYFVLFYVIASFFGGIVDGVTGALVGTAVVSLALFIPSISVGARRLHDTGRSGWWQLL